MVVFFSGLGNLLGLIPGAGMFQLTRLEQSFNHMPWVNLGRCNVNFLQTLLCIVDMNINFPPWSRYPLRVLEMVALVRGREVS